MQCNSTTGSKAAPQHEAATVMLGSWQHALRFQSLTFTLHNFPLVIVTKKLNFVLLTKHLTIKLSSRRDLACRPVSVHNRNMV